MATIEERAKRGYDLSTKERVESNLLILRVRALEAREETATLGYGVAVPGMIQEHRILVIDTLTGMIYLPAELQRMGYRQYEHAEQDVATLNYKFSTQDPRKQPTINLPRGYLVLPTSLEINENELSIEAVEVFEKTKQELFKPIFYALREALKNATKDPKTFARIGVVMATIEKQIL